MPLGNVFAVGFFLALSFAALSSLISMIELSTRVAVDFGVDRSRALPGVAAAAFAVGLPSAIWGDFFGNQDFVWGVALILSGAFIAFAVTTYGPDRLRDETRAEADWRLPRVWGGWLRVAIPLQAVVLLAWWLWQATTADFAERWWDPTEPYSAATVLLQWAVVLVPLVVLNRWMARRSGTLVT